MNKPYSIDFTTNTVTVTRKFLEAASVMGNNAFETMQKLRAMNLTIVVNCAVKKKNSNLTYAKMEKYISLLDEADKYMEEYETVRKESKAYDAAYAYVLKWFKNTFPNYGKLPERNVDLKIVNIPENYDAEESARVAL